MARSLPLQAFTPDTPVEATEPSAQALAGTVAVFDPALCCPTGVCGPGVDPALLQIARDLRWLEAQGVSVTRVGLSQEPQAFVAHPKVSGLLQAFGDGALPAVLVNDTVLAHGRYATREELVTALAAGASALVPAVSTTANSCCTPETGCC
jgi:hypothetical protein